MPKSFLTAFGLNILGLILLIGGFISFGGFAPKAGAETLAMEKSPALVMAFDPGEPLLYPAGCPTADTLRPGGVLIAPLGWMSYGVAQDFTVMLDWLLALGGVPAGYLRYRLPGSTPDLGFALEAYGFYLPTRVADQLTNFPNLIVEQRYWQSWLHVNGSWRMDPTWRLHAYAGATYDPYQRYAPEGSAEFTEVIYLNTVTPDWGIGLECSVAPWLKIHLNYLAGNTLYFFDQIPQKNMATLAFHIAPFPRDWIGILSRMRIEFTGFVIYVEPAKLVHTCPPFFPIVTWQW